LAKDFLQIFVGFSDLKTFLVYSRLKKSVIKYNLPKIMELKKGESLAKYICPL